MKRISRLIDKILGINSKNPDNQDIWRLVFKFFIFGMVLIMCLNIYTSIQQGWMKENADRFCFSEKKAEPVTKEYNGGHSSYFYCYGKEFVCNTKKCDWLEDGKNEC